MLQIKRREGLVSHMPPHIAHCHKDALLSSPMDSSLIFDPQTLTQVIKDVKEDSSTSTLVAVSKAVSLPSFAALRAARKASSGGSAAAKDQVGSGTGRGRCRGQQSQGQAADRGYKRKFTSHASGPVSKSPRKGSRSPRGRGFTQ